MNEHLRECPKCQGSMLFEEDWYGTYSTCLLCGYVYEYGSDSPEAVTNEPKVSEEEGLTTQFHNPTDIAITDLYQGRGLRGSRF